MDAEISTQLYVVGTADTVLIREVSLIKSVLYREVPLYCHPTQNTTLVISGCPKC